MRTMSVLLAIGCAPPPEIALSSPEVLGEPSIRILYPEDQQLVQLEPGCILTEPIIVEVENFALVEDGEPVETEGHWHGGPDLDEGYCKSSGTFCRGMGPEETPPEEGLYTLYDGTGYGEGSLNLYVSLHTSDHTPLGVQDLVEVILVSPVEGLCP